MERVRRNKLRWLWPAALVILITLHFWSPDFGIGIRHDSYHATTQGKLAFFYLLRADPEVRGYDVSRNRDPLVRATKVRQRSFSRRRRDQNSKIICLLGPARYPNAAEWKRLLSWVEDGGTLIVAARDDKPEFKIKELDIEVKRVRRRIDADSDDIRTSLIQTGRLVWQSNAHIIASSRALRVVQAANTTQAIHQIHGSGQVVVVAGDFIFSNQSLAWADHSNAELALRLVDPRRDGRPSRREIVVDESLNISGTPKVVGLLLNPLFLPLTVQMLIALVIFCWWRSLRFGPRTPPAVKARHNIVDHTDAVGTLHFRSRDGTAALRAYLRQFFAELKLKSFKGREDRVIEPIAIRMGKSTKSIRKLFRSAAKLARSKNLDRHTAASVIRKLALVRSASRRKPPRLKKRK